MVRSLFAVCSITRSSISTRLQIPCESERAKTWQPDSVVIPFAAKLWKLGERRTPGAKDVSVLVLSWVGGPILDGSFLLARMLYAMNGFYGFEWSPIFAMSVRVVSRMGSQTISLRTPLPCWLTPSVFLRLP